jgi:hypothetical protein
LPSLVIADVIVNEDETASLKVSLSKPSSQAVTVAYATKDDSAVADTDYTAKLGTLTFAAGVTEQTIEVVTLTTDSYQPNSKTLTVELSNPANASISDSKAVVTIRLAPPEAADLTLSFGNVKTFSFSWQDSPKAAYYQLFEDPDGQSGYTQVGEDIEPNIQAVDHIVPLYARVNARYLLKSCNASGCKESGPVHTSPRLSDITASIGYFKSSNTDVRDDFGGSVSLSVDGNTLAVGAPFENSSAIGIDGGDSAEENNGAEAAGAVYVFTRTATGWTQQAYIKASNTGPLDRFGHSVSLSADGNTLAVGAIWEGSGATGINGGDSVEENNDANAAGAVYVFTRTATDWSQQAYIKASNTGVRDSFGGSVSLSADGNTLAVGAPYEDSNATGINGEQTNNNADEAGAVYVFTRTATDWSQQAYIKASNTDADDWFGNSVSLSADGNTLAVGAFKEDSNATYSGAVYVFTRTATDWSQQAFIKASNTGGGDLFGNPVSLSADGNTLAVGAIWEGSNATGINGGDSAEENNDAEDAGAVYVFTRTATDWSQQAYIKASNTGTGDRFGASVSLSADGNTLAVGAIWEGSNAIGINGGDSVEENNDAEDAGAVYVFTRTASVWSQQAYIKASNTGPYDEFGTSVSLSADGNTLAVSAPYEDSNATGINGDQMNNSLFSAGAVYVY